MNEEEFIDLLQELLLEQTEEMSLGVDITDIRSFEEAMLLTKDKGILVKLESGEEFQVTVVRSK